MTKAAIAAGAALVVALVGGGWVVAFHGDWIRRAPEAEEDEKVETEVPVRTAKIVRATLRRTIDGYGTVVPEPAHDGKPAAGSKLAAAVAGVLAKASCGQRTPCRKLDWSPRMAPMRTVAEVTRLPIFW